MNGILNDQYSDMLANSINHYQSIQHNIKLETLMTENDMVFVKAYNLTPFKDGNQWCILLGENIQVGIVGFGDTPIRAIRDFNSKFYK